MVGAHMKPGCRLWHRWSVWTDVMTGLEQHFDAPKEDNRGYPVVIQERRCLRCNQADRRTVRP